MAIPTKPHNEMIVIDTTAAIQATNLNKQQMYQQQQKWWIVFFSILLLLLLLLSFIFKPVKVMKRKTNNLLNK